MARYNELESDQDRGGKIKKRLKKLGICEDDDPLLSWRYTSSEVKAKYERCSINTPWFGRLYTSED